MSELGAPGVSYRLVLPPDWLLLPVRDSSDAELRKLIEKQYEKLPRDSSRPHIKRLASQVVEAVSSMREAHVIDVIMPLGTPWLAPISAAIAIAVGSGGLPEQSEFIETQAGEAIREQQDHPSNALRRVEYVWRIPRSSDQLLVASFSIVGEKDDQFEPIADALTELCDMILATLRWEISEAGEAPEDPGTAATKERID